ncbi:hypothetical protein [Antrihabitans sp. YC2-6]|uniref:hypothetical protein n=1 Tax=Antrihabitans sp. YC2-6 TaxID=2799498 RepID=UPI0018F5C3C0|nr:hypothetical protein [Antrihabitans sp. YC2-6]MBJ8344910.1 hypothetical protein [Antrihabitans sp. YC2-6]
MSTSTFPTHSLTGFVERFRDFFRPSGYMGSGYPADRDAERMFAEVIAVDRRGHGEC